MGEKPFRFIKKIDSLPTERRGRDSYYDEIIREFLYSGAKYAEVKDLGKRPLTVEIGLKNRVKRHRERIKVLLISKKVYLERLDLPQNAQLSSNNQKTGPSSSSEKISFEVIKVSNNAIVKARCPACNQLNSKDSRICANCGHDLYSTEKEFQDSVKEMETLERSLNGEA
jgi:Zn ribbon nucleic-acid-binding protein